MNLCRIIYKADGAVTVLHPNPSARRIMIEVGGKTVYYPETPEKFFELVGSEPFDTRLETEQEHLDRYYQEVAVKRPNLAGLDYDDIDSSQLPPRADRDKWRGSKAAGLAVDLSVVTVAERRQALEDALDAELAKPNPDPVEAMKMRRNLEKGNY